MDGGGDGRGGGDGGRYGEAAAAVMNGGDRCGRQGAFVPALVGPFRRRRHLPVDLHVLMWLRQRTERRAYWMSLPTIRSIALCCWLVMFAMYVSCSFVSYLYACYVCKCMFHILTFLSQLVGGSGVELSA